MKQAYKQLQEAFEGYVAGEMTEDALKHVSVLFGIYQQRNGAFMIRVRVNGGEIGICTLVGIAAVLEQVGGTVHLTSRQDLQLHDVPAARVVEAVRATDSLGLPFRGGGGNTYRNTVVGADSGLSPESVFDVYPYAHALNREILKNEQAFTLPRKFKIGFFACDRDLLHAAIQDVGFVATVREGKHGFRLYAGGGLGRESRVGVCLVDFLPVDQMFRAAFALIALFHDHGDRANRQQARLRFLVKRIGVESFHQLFNEYYTAIEVSRLRVRKEEVRLPANFWQLPPLAVAPSMATDERFALWEALAVLPTRFGNDVKSVRLFVPYGHLTAAQLRRVAALAEGVGSTFVRLLPTQDVLIPFVRRDALPALYARLRRDFAGLDLTFTSCRGHIVSCVGATVCKIGMADAPTVADRLADALDRHVPADTAARLALLRLVADGLRVSGCPNACAGHPCARIGVACLNQKVEGKIVSFGRVFMGAGMANGALCLSTEEVGAAPLPLAALTEAVLAKCHAPQNA